MILCKYLFKIVLSSLLLLILNPISISAKIKMEYYDTLGYKANYLGVKTFTYKIPLSKIKKYIYNNWNYYIVYKNKENKIKKYQYIKNGNIIFYEIYNYSPAKKLNQIKTYVNFNLISTLSIINKYKTKKTIIRDNSYIIRHFNKKNHLIKSLYYNKYKYLISYTLFEYNPQGLLIKQSYYDPNNNLIEYKKMIYNGKNQKVKVEHYSSYKQMISYNNYYYNQKGLVERKERYNSNKKLLGYSEYEYNRGNLRYTLHYNSKGRLIIK